MSDKRLYTEMLAVLTTYDENRVGFRGLLDRLEECADRIQDDIKWQEDFRRVWDLLETPYALAASRGLKQIPDEKMPSVVAALEKVREMVGNKVAAISDAESD